MYRALAVVSLICLAMYLAFSPEQVPFLLRLVGSLAALGSALVLAADDKRPRR